MATEVGDHVIFCETHVSLLERNYTRGQVGMLGRSIACWTVSKGVVTNAKLERKVHERPSMRSLKRRHLEGEHRRWCHGIICGEMWWIALDSLCYKS